MRRKEYCPAGELNRNPLVFASHDFTNFASTQEALAHTKYYQSPRLTIPNRMIL